MSAETIGNVRLDPVFTPRTVAAIERMTRSFVSRFADPVRVIGMRTLGFADRILGWRLGEPRVVAPPVIFRSGGGPGSGGVVMVRPWYSDEVEVPQAYAEAQLAEPTPALVEAPVAAPPVPTSSSSPEPIVVDALAPSLPTLAE